MAFFSISPSRRTMSIKICPPRPTPSSVDLFTRGVDIFLNMAESNGWTPEEAKPRWKTRDHTTDEYIPNEKCWARYVNLSCCAVEVTQGTTSQYNKTATLITPSCAIMSQHYGLSPGNKVGFINTSGAYIERTVQKAVKHYDYQPYWPDLKIVSFTEPVVGCIPAHILPMDWRNYIPNKGWGLPCLKLDKQDHCSVGEVSSIATPDMCSIREPQSQPRKRYHENLVGGDSSDPCFLIGLAVPIILTTWTYGGWGSGTSINHFAEYKGKYNWIDQTCMNLAGEKPVKAKLTNGT